MDNTLKTHTKYSHTVRGRPTLKKMSSVFGTGRSTNFYERTFTSDPFIETHATSKPSMSELIGLQRYSLAF